MPIRQIAATVGRIVASISRHLRSFGLPSLLVRYPVQVVLRYERPALGEFLYMDPKKLRGIEREGHPINGDRPKCIRVAAGSMPKWPSTITRGWVSSRCIRTRGKLSGGVPASGCGASNA